VKTLSATLKETDNEQVLIGANQVRVGHKSLKQWLFRKGRLTQGIVMGQIQNVNVKKRTYLFKFTF